DVVLAQPLLAKFEDAKLAGILTRLPGRAESLPASGYHELYPLRINAERRRTFRGIERPNPAAGTSANVDQPAAIRESFGDPIDAARNFRQTQSDCGGDLYVFSVDDPGDFKR